jgi:hypothetical protein
MAYYRIFFLNYGNRVCGFYRGDFESDRTAIQAAKQWLGSYPSSEMWQDTRCVARLSPNAVDEAPQSSKFGAFGD